MPIIADVVDAFRRAFGVDQVRIVFAEESGRMLDTAPATSEDGRQ